MTPQEIFDYKMRWKPGFTVTLHSDLDVKGKSWLLEVNGGPSMTANTK